MNTYNTDQLVEILSLTSDLSLEFYLPFDEDTYVYKDVRDKQLYIKDYVTREKKEFNPYNYKNTVWRLQRSKF